jgi:hypothetical protein
MPIKKELYPANWNEISLEIRQRAGNKCESCGVANHAFGARDLFGDWHNEDDIHSLQSDVGYSLFGDEEFPWMIRIVLTVAHLNQNPADNRPENLKCLCQRCHLNHDRPFNITKIRETWARKRRARIAQTGQLTLEGWQ